ncbi:MAG TPA: hypothetical protein VGE37_14610 [Archangium sp.]
MRSLLLIALVSVPVLAQTQKPDARQKTTELVFGDEDVIDGQLSAPDLGYVVTPHGPKDRPSIIRVRTNFADKVMESAREL